MDWLRQHQTFQTHTPQAELAWNAPQEWRPQTPHGKGILFVHGLGDSPWSFHNLGHHLAKQGFLVRSLLLPGHGTHPKDMLEVRLEDWCQVVSDQAQRLGQEVTTCGWLKPR